MTTHRANRAAALPLTPAAVKARFTALEHVPALFALPAPQLRVLARRARLEWVPAGATVFRQGEDGDAMHVVLSGRCELSVVNGSGHPVTVGLVTPGGVFGEEGVALREARFTSARAAEDTELLCIDSGTLSSTVVQDSEAMAELRRMAEQRRVSAGLLAGWTAQTSAGDPSVSLAVYSSKGGSGRTTVALNLAAQLARTHPGEVVVIDLALPFNDVALMCDLVPLSCLALLGETPPAEFEELLLSALMPHPTGFMVLPGVLRPEQSELVAPELVQRAVEALRRSFRFVIFDLPTHLSDITLAVLERVDRILFLATSELAALKDFGEVRRLFNDVLKIVPSRVLVALNHRAPNGVIDRGAVQRSLGQELVCEFPFQGPKLDEAAIRGQVLSVSDPRSSMARTTALLGERLGAGALLAQPRRKRVGLR
jgi:Flp pilus assembly CpaE family ATPase